MATDTSPIQLLSAAPWFDQDTAIELLALGNLEKEAAMSVLNRVRGGGLTIRRGDLERIQEPMRTESRRSLFGEDESLYVSALRTFSQRSRSELGEKLRGVLGEEGTFLVTRAIECVAEDDPAVALNELVTRLEGEPEQFDGASSVAIARLIEAYSFKRTRLSDFFEGLALWAAGSQRAAVHCFDRVVQDKRVDRPGAISEHLLGVVYYRDGRLGEAERILRNSLNHLTAIHDLRGLEVTLCTYGRLKREVYRRTYNDAALGESIEALQQARELSSGLPGRRERTLQYLSQSLTDAGQHVEAIKWAKEACRLATAGESGVNARTTLALAYRDAGLEDEYTSTLQEAADMAERDNVAGKTLARLLNMRAAALRREGNLVQAEEMAQRSVGLGRLMYDDTHIAHATHTLAAISIDRMEKSGFSVVEASAAAELLELARTALSQSNDVRGVGMIDETSAKLTAMIRRAQR